MKKTIVMAALGLVAGVTSSFGQGTIVFNSYTAAGGSGVLTKYGSDQGGNAGLGLTSAFTVGLLYSLTPFSDAATTSGASASLPLLGTLTDSGITAIFQTSAGGAPGGTGYFQAPNFTLASGAPNGTTVYFEVLAFQTAAGNYAASTIRGHSASFSATLAATDINGPHVPSNLVDSMTPFAVFSVVAVPEPTTLALAGLGGLASLVMLRRKNA